MDITSLGFAALIVIGVVNVVTMFKSNLTSTQKFGIALVTAFVVGFVPASFANELANRIKDALSIALASSGGYKIATKAGGS